MFKYDDTKKLSQSGEKQHKVVTERRNVSYTHFVYEKNKRYRKVADHEKVNIAKLLEGGWRLKKTLETPGWEIVTEIVIDPRGPNKELVNVR